jgi:heptaprenyl diphosphate synthase
VTVGTPPTDPEWLASARTAATLANLDRRIEESLASTDIALRAMATALLRRSGKRIRPALLLLAAEFGTFRPGPLVDAAAALELFHLASLYHDDVMDRALRRRHGPSVNAQWGEPAAVVAGTFLVAQAVRLLAPLDDACGREAAAAIVRLCSGQLQESENAFHTGLSESQHLEIIARKTATLFELPCRLGARLAEVREPFADALLRYAGSLGVAFQLADDALDVRGSAETLGKQPLSDVREGVYTLSVLRLLAGGGPATDRLRELLEVLDPTAAEVTEIATLVIGSGLVDEVLAQARTLAAQAREHLDPLPDGPARESLLRLAEHAVARAN